MIVVTTTTTTTSTSSTMIMIMIIIKARRTVGEALLRAQWERQLSAEAEAPGMYTIL